MSFRGWLSQRFRPCTTGWGGGQDGLLGTLGVGSTSWLFLLELCGQSGEISKPLGLSLSHLESGNANISSLR